MTTSDSGSPNTDGPASTREADRVVVVVEDDASMRTSMERTLRAGGWMPRSFDSAEAALRAGAALLGFPMVVDVGLPGISGLELIGRLRELGGTGGVVVVTGRDEPSVRDRAAALGALAFLPKPLRSRQLLDAVADAVAHAAAPSKPGCADLDCADGIPPLPGDRP